MSLKDQENNNKLIKKKNKEFEVEDIPSPALSLPLKTIKYFGGLRLAGVLWKILETTRPRRTFLITEEYINTLNRRKLLIQQLFFLSYFSHRILLR